MGNKSICILNVFTSFIIANIYIATLRVGMKGLDDKKGNLMIQY